MRTGRSTSRHGRVRRGEKGTASREDALNGTGHSPKVGSARGGGLAEGRTIEEVAPSESEPHWVTAKSRNRITFRKRGTTGSGAGAQHPQGRVRSYLCGASALCEGASSGEPNGGVDDGPSDELVGASEPSPPGPSTADVKGGRFPFGPDPARSAAPGTFPSANLKGLHEHPFRCCS